MGAIQKIGQADAKINYNRLVFVMLFIAVFVGGLWLQTKGLDAGAFYLGLSFAGLVSYSFVRITESKKVDDFIPLNISLNRGVLFLLLVF